MVSYVLQIEGKSFPLIMYAGPFVLWILFFMLGIWYSTHSRNYSLWPVWIVIFVGLVASVIESKYYLPMHGSGMGIKLSSFVFSAGMIMLLFCEKLERIFRKNYVTKLIIYVWGASFPIYLIHMYVKIILSQFMVLYLWAMSWMVILIISLVIIELLRRLLPAKFAKTYLGINENYC